MKEKQRKAGEGGKALEGEQKENREWTNEIVRKRRETSVGLGGWSMERKRMKRRREMKKRGFEELLQGIGGSREKGNATFLPPQYIKWVTIN